MKNLLVFLAAALAPISGAVASEMITYTYDAHGRLTNVAKTGTVNAGVQAAYAYDKADNRTTKAVTGSPWNAAASKVVIVNDDGLRVIVTE